MHAASHVNELQVQYKIHYAPYTILIIVSELQELSLNKQLYAEYHGYQFYFSLSDEWEGFFPQRGSLGDSIFAHRDGRDAKRVPGEFVKVGGLQV
jgi:hypothetical protein